MGFIRFDNGACLQIEFSWASNVDAERVFVELRGDKAGTYWHNCNATIYREENGQMLAEPINNPQPGPGHEMCLRHYVDVVLNGAEPIFVPQQGVDMIKILSAIYESAKTGREVSLI
jgi:predicted dehydrogenase